MTMHPSEHLDATSDPALPAQTRGTRTPPTGSRQDTAVDDTALDDTALDDTALAGGTHGPRTLDTLLAHTLAALAAGARERGGPLPAGGPGEVAADLRAVLDSEALPEHGVGATQALTALARAAARGAADPADPSCAGHLHCPPLAVAVAADLVASVLNQSLDSWDQAPMATALENEVITALAGLVGYPAGACGTVTTGGTESNMLGLLLARDHGGAPAGAGQVGPAPHAATTGLRVLCSRAAHFSVQRGAALLGLGEDAVVPVDCDTSHRLDPVALDTACTQVRRRGERPVAVVATAGTTDLGAVDPLPQVAAVAAAHGAWLHVDAAYGGGALFSRRLAALLHGVDRAHSLSLDLHKLGWQPAPAGVFLVREGQLMAPLRQRVAYLNPDDDEQAGYPSLLGHSPRTTRRPDVFKIAVTLRTLGRAGLGTLVDRCHDLARYAASAIARHPDLELHHEPVLTSVVFRYLPPGTTGDPVSARHCDEVNADLRRALLRDGAAVVGRTEIGTGPGRVRLKLTLLNPHTSPADIDALLEVVCRAGRATHRAAARPGPGVARTTTPTAADMTAADGPAADRVATGAWSTAGERPGRPGHIPVRPGDPSDPVPGASR